MSPLSKREILACLFGVLVALTEEIIRIHTGKANRTGIRLSTFLIGNVPALSVWVLIRWGLSWFVLAFLLAISSVSASFAHTYYPIPQAFLGYSPRLVALVFSLLSRKEMTQGLPKECQTIVVTLNEWLNNRLLRMMYREMRRRATRFLHDTRWEVINRTFELHKLPMAIEKRDDRIPKICAVPVKLHLLMEHFSVDGLEKEFEAIQNKGDEYFPTWSGFENRTGSNDTDLGTARRFYENPGAAGLIGGGS